jgi:transposase-like protein
MNKKTKRRQHSAEFKARVALEAYKGVKTVSQIAAENKLHPVQVTQWKTQLKQSASGVFEGVRSQAKEELARQADQEHLERKIGQLVVEVDWLSKKCKELGIDP